MISGLSVDKYRIYASLIKKKEKNYISCLCNSNCIPNVSDSSHFVVVKFTADD